MRKIWNGLRRILLTIVVFVSMLLASGYEAFAAGLQGPSSATTVQGVMDVMKVYNPDVYYFLEADIRNNPSDATSFAYFMSGDTIASGIDTGVHETYHYYTFHGEPDIPFAGERIYVGGNTSYTIDYRNLYFGGILFPTSEMSAGIPSSLRTFRYSTYVSSGAGADANTKGPVGLINEFSAYYWGLNTMDSLIPYFQAYGAGKDAWTEYVKSLGNNMTAYTEFKYWILGYMNYAKVYHPETYKAILEDVNICKAYAATEMNFAALIDKSVSNIPAINASLASKNLKLQCDQSGAWCKQGGSGRGVTLTDYYKLKTELEKPEYVEMDAIMKQAAGLSPQTVVNPSTPSDQTVVMVTTQSCSIWSAPSTKEANRVKVIPAGYKVTVIPVPVSSTNNDGKVFYRTVKGSYILARVLTDEME